MRMEGIKFVQTKPVKVHPIKEGRRVPLKQLIKRLNVQNYDVPAPYNAVKPQASEVKILLKQHAGETAVPLVKIGDRVTKGTTIASVVKGKLGANIHSSIDGMITQVTGDYIKIKS